MIKKIICITIIILFMLSCSKESNNVTSPLKSSESGYTIKGLDSKYNGNWKFFNADKTGNRPVDVTINNGMIKGLIVSNKTEKVNFDKDGIYSSKIKKENLYYGRYYGYIISYNDWVGEIQFPVYEDETVGYVYIKNKNSSDMIVGMIDKSPAPKEMINKGYTGKRSCIYNGIKRTVDVQEDFVSYYENDQLKVTIPASFFDLSKGDGFYGYTVMLGLLYYGVSINAYNSKNASILPSIYFEYIDDNYHLDIKLKNDGSPASAKYIQNVNIISPGNILYFKE